MPTYAYTALHPLTGRHVRARVEAENREAAVALLRAQRLRLLALDEAPPLTGWRARFASAQKASRHRMSAAQRAWFTRQLAALVGAGLPLLQSLEAMARQESSPGFRQIVLELTETVRSGRSLSTGLEQHPRVFDRLYINLVKAGEAGGLLEEVLERLAGFLDKRERLKGRVRAALAYPVVVATVAAVIVSALTILVVPRFEQLFLTQLQGRPLPALTQSVLGVSRFMEARAGLLAGIVVVGAVALAAGGRRPRGRALGEQLAERLPLAGPIVVRARVARLGRTLGTLLAAGVPILSALALTRAATGSAVVQRLLAAAEREVEAGRTLASVVGGRARLPAVVPAMIEVGETTGKLPEMLIRLADIYDEEVDQAVTTLTSLLEPALIVTMAILVGTIVVALFLPMVELIRGLSGG
ncbi:MAG: type II secretion system F family protein [Opitutaceae bacterium]|nr:type II secretion system F family protein [Opitutaceae bacterium]